MNVHSRHVIKHVLLFLLWMLLVVGNRFNNIKYFEGSTVNARQLQPIRLIRKEYCDVANTLFAFHYKSIHKTLLS